jgi:hypothetical protein
MRSLRVTLFFLSICSSLAKDLMIYLSTRGFDDTKAEIQTTMRLDSNAELDAVLCDTPKEVRQMRMRQSGESG